MAKKPKKGEPLDHQQEHPNDPVLVPDFTRIKELTSKMTLESAGGAQGPGYEMIFETICGTTDDSQPVELYDGTLGVSTAFVNDHQSPVGVIRWNSNLASIYDNPGNVAGQRWCTGTMISNDLFLTAGHCFDQTGGTWQRPRVNGTSNIISPDQIAENMSVEFNYQADSTGTIRTPTSVAVVELVEYRLGGLDFAIARLAGSPGSQWGVARMAEDDGAVNDMMCIIGHPAGQPKRIEAGPITSFQGDRIRYNDIDTLGGNSGSGLLRESDGCIIGIHTNGGCNAAMTGSNFGVKITALRRESPTIQSIRAHTNVFADTAAPHTSVTADITTTPSSDRVTSVFADRATITWLDMATSVIADRLTTALSDRPTSILADHGGTNPIFDNRGSFNKALDDRKSTGKDKQFSDRKLPGQDGLGTFGRFGSRPLAGAAGGAAGGARPFVLSTPHHAPGIESSPAQGGVTPEDYQEALAEIEAAMAEMGAQMETLQEQYEALLAEAREICG